MGEETSLAGQFWSGIKVETTGYYAASNMN